MNAGPFEQLVTVIDSRHSPAVLWEESPDAMCGTCQWSSPHVVHSGLCSPPGRREELQALNTGGFIVLAGLKHDHYKRDRFESMNLFF